MFERRNLWYFLASLALLMTPFTLFVRPVLAAGSYTVTSLLDTGGTCISTPNACTLRQAIEAANNDHTDSTINFSVTGVITLDVSLNGPLNLTESNTKIEALINYPAITQPPVEIRGQGTNEPAFTIISSGNTIKGLSITGFTGTSQPQGAAVLITGSAATGNTVIGNYIGVRPDGTTLGANYYGIRIESSAASNTVSNNIIVGSSVSGILIKNARQNILISNLIGIGLNSTVLPNQTAGIEITSDLTGTSTGNIIGGTRSEANFISSNGPIGSTTNAGILIRASNTTGNYVRSNLIGTDINGTSDLGNHGDGIRIAAGASTNSIIGTTADPLVISGNSGYGIRVTGFNTTGNQISGVYVGVNQPRLAMLANELGGIMIDQGAIANTITGTVSDPTLIGGNSGGPGVIVAGSSTVRNQVLNSYIGVAAHPVSGVTLTFANAGGVVVREGAQKTTISGNTISGNSGYGLRLSASQTVTITNNFIGLNIAHTGTTPNVGPGIDVQDSSTDTLIGGGTAALNYLAGNSGPAITISGVQTLRTTVSYNVIGQALGSGGSYNEPAGNGGDGILVSNGPKNTTISSNTIGSNTGSGVRIAGSATTTATLTLNRVGLVVVGSTIYDRPNATSGIALDTTKFIDVTSNVVGYNLGSGIIATNVQTVTLRSNQSYQHTSGSGIEIAGSSRYVQVLSNTLTLNRDYGVLVQGTSQRVRIQYNRISQNTTGGVRLQSTTISNGSAPDDVTTLPNHGIDPPIFDPANTNPLRVRIDQTGAFSGWVYTNTATLPASACSPVTQCQVQFFRSADNLDGQGYSSYKVTPVDGGTATDFTVPNAQGYFTGRLSFGSSETLPKQLIFAVTDKDGNTSEFGALSISSGLSLTYLNPVTGKQNAAPTQTVTYTIRLDNTGTVGLTNVNVVTSNTLARWTISPANGVSNLVTIPANSTKTLTVTLTLPVGTDSNARANLQDITRVTASASGRLQTPINKTWILTTTVSPLPVLSVSTVLGSGSAVPGGQVTHTHRFSNSGNYTVTLNMTARTIDPANSGYVWNTTLSALTLEIPPGGNKTVDAVITIPAGAQVYDSLGNLVRVTTVVTGTGQSPFTSVVKSASGTTGVNLVARAQMSGNGGYTQAASLAQVSFDHNVTNTSNGPARFCLRSRSNSGSTVASFTSQNGVVISSSQQGNCFQLDAPGGAAATLRFRALINVTSVLYPGDVEHVDIYLINADTGLEVQSASVRDNIEITASPLLPRIWLPMIIQ